MEFIGILGDRGSGKTNLTTKYLYDAYLAGSRIVANYTLKFPHILMSFGEIRKVPQELQGAVIGLDELVKGADSYDFFTKDTRALTDMVADLRKMHATTYYNIQRFSMAARRLRILTDGLILMDDPDKYKMTYSDGRKAKIHREVCGGIFRTVYVDENGRIIRSKMFNGRPYWDKYNTDERIWG